MLHKKKKDRRHVTHHNKNEHLSQADLAHFEPKCRDHTSVQTKIMNVGF